MAIIQSETLRAMVGWRHDLHAHPELAFNEFRTSDLIAAELAALGLAVHRGLGKTGVVGTLAKGAGRAIGLRADMDALPVKEMNVFAHRSQHVGSMHACGHDGHTAMLLGAARHLAAHRNFRGTVHFIFQPAEENEGGGRAMVEDGLFQKFPCDAVYGMHNWPGLPAGQFAINHGPMMAAYDTFEITVQGQGTHAAMPERGIDPFVSTAQIILALQTIPSRMFSAMESVIVSVTQVHGGDAWNVIPDAVVLRGSVRCFSAAIQDRAEQALRHMCCSIAEAHGATVTVKYERRYPPTINTSVETDVAIAAASAVVGAGNVQVDCQPSMASEDFAFMLQAKPGAYIWIGADGVKAQSPLHSPHSDFNDDTLELGAAYWVSLVEAALELAKSPP
jgi:amidohydrolase